MMSRKYCYFFHKIAAPLAVELFENLNDLHRISILVY